MFYFTVHVPLLQCILCSTFERMLPLSIVRFEKIHYYSIMVPPPTTCSTDLFGKKKTEHLLCFKILNVFHFYKINVNCFTFTVKCVPFLLHVKNVFYFYYIYSKLCSAITALRGPLLQ